MEIAKREMTMEEIISSLDIDSMQKERLMMKEDARLWPNRTRGNMNLEKRMKIMSA